MRRNQKGFLIVLCLCMLSVSGIFGVYQYRKGQNQEADPGASGQSAQADETQEAEPEKEAANSEGTVAKADTEENQTEAKIETEEDIYEIGEAELAQAEEPAEQTDEEPEDTSAAEEEETEEDTEEEAEVPAAEQFAFAEDSQLIWPVDGDVILNYSMDKSIYFSTLNQYKYHPAIVISADVGSEVRCAARGRVTGITVNEETGTTLTMDLGSGYQAVYGQLKEVSVEEGDTVESGTVIGYVSEPTKYYTLEGSNLYFQLRKDQEPVNPMNYME